jgi:predicted lipoprotein with Yx(FWY)xxD motif
VRPTLTVKIVVASASVVALAVAGTALGQSSAHKTAQMPFTLKIAKNVLNNNTSNSQFAVKKVNVRENIAVGPNGFAVYTFQGETTHHIICKKSHNPANNCWSFWPPATVKSASGLSKQAGIKGKLGTFQNQGKLQLTLNGKPLYYFTPDIQSHDKRVATSDETKTYGSIWHIVKAAGPTSPASGSNNPPKRRPPGY